MKYLCMLFFDEQKLNALSDIQQKELIEESLAYNVVLQESGRFHAAQALKPVCQAKTIRLAGGRVSVIDGPFAETKEQIGGFILIDACDTNEAIELASRIPVVRLGGVEVRPIQEMPPPPSEG